MSDNDDNFLTDVRDVLNESVTGMDARLEQRLGALKYRALDEPAKTPKSFYRWGGVTVAAIITVLAFVNWPQQISVTESELVTLEIIGEPESFEFFQHDMEFYQWLSEEMKNENIPTSFLRGPGLSPDPARWNQGSGNIRERSNAEYRSESATDRVFRGVQG